MAKRAREIFFLLQTASTIILATTIREPAISASDMGPTALRTPPTPTPMDRTALMRTWSAWRTQRLRYATLKFLSQASLAPSQSSSPCCCSATCAIVASAVAASRGSPAAPSGSKSMTPKINRPSGPPPAPASPQPHQKRVESGAPTPALAPCPHSLPQTRKRASNTPTRAVSRRTSLPTLTCQFTVQTTSTRPLST